MSLFSSPHGDVECCHESCAKWRYLPLVKDPSVLPDFWTCSMHPDLKDCQAEEEAIEVES